MKKIFAYTTLLVLILSFSIFNAQISLSEEKGKVINQKYWQQRERLFNFFIKDGAAQIPSGNKCPTAGDPPFFNRLF